MLFKRIIIIKITFDITCQLILMRWFLGRLTNFEHNTSHVPVTCTLSDTADKPSVRFFFSSFILVRGSTLPGKVCVCARVCLSRRGWLSVSVTSAALHLVLIASELITPASVKQCCQTSPAQPSCRRHRCPSRRTPRWPNGGDGGGRGVALEVPVKNLKLLPRLLLQL